MSFNNGRSGLVTLLLVLLPVWLVASAGGALWYYFHREKKLAAIEQERFAKAVSIPILQDDLRKIVEIIGERNTSSPVASANLSRTASMIEGTLGPSNIGYAVKKILGPAEWPLLQVTLRGKKPDIPPIWIIAAYDSPRGSRGGEKNAAGLAATLAAAQTLALDKPLHPVHFIFIPHAEEAGPAADATSKKLAALLNDAGPSKLVLFIEAMGENEALWLGDHGGMKNIAPLMSGLGSIYQAENAPNAPIGRLFAAGIPAFRLATTVSDPSPESDAKVPFAPTVAASSGRLIELIRRLAPE